jgi:hypothetical protein
MEKRKTLAFIGLRTPKCPALIGSAIPVPGLSKDSQNIRFTIQFTKNFVPDIPVDITVWSFDCSGRHPV